MKKTLFIILFATLLAGCFDKDKPQTSGDVANNNEDTAYSSATSDTTDDIIATVNGRKIPKARIKVYAPIANEQDPEVIIDNIITSELISQEAIKEEMNKQPDIAQQIEVAVQTVLGRAYAQKFIGNNPVDNAAIQARYEELKKSFTGSFEYETAHILVAEKAQADELHAQIVADGSRFADLAQEHSLDTGSAGFGGALGWTAPQALVPEYAQAMQQTEPENLVPAPVKTQFGWHIIRVDNKRPLTTPALSDELRQQLTQTIQAEKFSQHLEELRKSSEIVRL